MTTILIVDDSAIMRSRCVHALEAEGYTCIQADNGAKAIGLYKESHADVVLMDVNMPELSGLHATTRIREIDKDAVIIIMSSDGSMDNIRQAIIKGAKHYIRKPVSPETLLKVVKKFLPQKQAAVKRLAEEVRHVADTSQTPPSNDLSGVEIFVDVEVMSPKDDLYTVDTPSAPTSQNASVPETSVSQDPEAQQQQEPAEQQPEEPVAQPTSDLQQEDSYVAETTAGSSQTIESDSQSMNEGPDIKMDPIEKESSSIESEKKAEPSLSAEVNLVSGLIDPSVDSQLSPDENTLSFIPEDPILDGIDVSIAYFL